MNSPAPLHVGFPLYNGCTLVDFAGATQVFASSGFKVFWLAKDLKPVETTESVCVTPGYTFDNHPPLHLVFVPGGGYDGVNGAMFSKNYQAFLKRVEPEALFMGSVCTGAFVLAAAGLLDGCSATTYWSQNPTLDLFPKIHVPAGYPRWVIDVFKRRFTGGGVSSSIDLALELVNLIKGPDGARMTQLSIQYAPSPPYQSGDPSKAPPEIVEKLEQTQLKPFTEPLRAAVVKLLA